ncbi:LysR family transcriptional regulator [Pseudomonas chlororaphis]|nr:LysR family transcriptional regulator [Pseudomonas chlororaphis]
MDRFKSLKVFSAAVEAGSLVAAGRRFGLSASMAGKYLSALEAELNVRLIQRSTRSLSLTEAGRAYHARCQRILEALEEADREASDTQHALRGKLRICAPVTFGSLHMAQPLARFMAEHPQLDTEIVLDDRYVDLHTAGIDIAIRIGRLPDSELIARALAPCRMVLCAAPAFLQREGVPSRPEDLRDSPRLAFSEAVSSGAWTLSDAQQQPHLIEGPVRMYANNMHMLLAAALAGLGIAYGPTFVFGQALAAGDLVRILPDFSVPDLTIQAVYPTARYVPSKVRQFIDYMAAEFEGLPAWDRF